MSRWMSEGQKDQVWNGLQGVQAGYHSEFGGRQGQEKGDIDRATKGSS